MHTSAHEFRTIVPAELSPAEIADLVETVRELYLWFSPDSTDEDIANRLCGDETAVVDVAYLDGKPCGFGVYTTTEALGFKITYRSGTVIAVEARGRGLYHEMVERCIRQTGPDYIVTRTQNPRIYETIRKVVGCDIYPCEGLAVPELISELARACNHNEAVDATTLVVREIYGDLREDRSHNTARDHDLERFFRAHLGRNDGFMVVAPVGAVS